MVVGGGCANRHHPVHPPAPSHLTAPRQPAVYQVSGREREREGGERESAARAHFSSFPLSLYISFGPLKLEPSGLRMWHGIRTGSCVVIESRRQLVELVVEWVDPARRNQESGRLGLVRPMCTRDVPGISVCYVL